MDDYILYISLLLITIIIIFQLYKEYNISKEEYKSTNKMNINFLSNINHLARYLL
jgi:hypothetical protein